MIHYCRSLVLVCFVVLQPLVLSQTSSQSKPTSSTTTTSSSSRNAYDTTRTTAADDDVVERRERNIDFISSKTLAYYLGIDLQTYEPVADAPLPQQQQQQSPPQVAVMFYSQWDSNSHAFAPYWDRIATYLNAGKANSNLIMALFDCEVNLKHKELCNHIRTSSGLGKKVITKKYPSLMFIFPPSPSSSSQQQQPSTTTTTTPKKQTKKKKTKNHRKLPQMFKGNWQYGDAVLDWIRTMQMIGGWDKFWNKHKNRNFIANNPKSNSQDLPVGIPVSSNNLPPPSSSSYSSASSSPATSTTQEVTQLTEENKQLTSLVIRSSVFVDSILFPLAHPLEGLTSTSSTSNDTKTYTDMFSLVYDYWLEDDTTKKKTSPSSSSSVVLSRHEQEIVKACVMEISLDYCERVSQHMIQEIYEDILVQGTASAVTMESLELEIDRKVNASDPYCAIIEQCVATNFVPEKCRPPSCPFPDVACRYATGCLADSTQEQYAEALNISVEELQKAKEENLLAQYELYQKQKQQTPTTTTTSQQKQEQQQQQQQQPDEQKSQKKEKKGGWFSG